MKQVTIFDVFDDLDKQNDIQSVLNGSWITIDGIVANNSKIIAIYFPNLIKCPLEEPKPSISTLEAGVYKIYRRKRGILYDDSMPDRFNWSPGQYWTWI